MEEKNAEELKAYVMRMESMEERPKVRAFVLVTPAGSVEITWQAHMPAWIVKLTLAQVLMFDLDAMDAGGEAISAGVEKYAHSCVDIVSYALEPKVQPTAADDEPSWV